MGPEYVAAARRATAAAAEKAAEVSVVGPQVLSYALAMQPAKGI